MRHPRRQTPKACRGRQPYDLPRLPATPLLRPAALLLRTPRLPRISHLARPLAPQEPESTTINDNDTAEALLGAILDGYPDVPKLARIITGADFAQPHHETIWQAILQAHKAGLKPDPVTVRHHMGSNANRLPGGPLYLAGLHGTPIQAEWYAQQIRDRSILRQAGNVGRKLQQVEADPEATAPDVLAKARQWLDSLQNHQQADTISAWDALEAAMHVIDHGEPAATPTPWPDLTDTLGGWYPGQLIIVGARPGVGKSIFLENAATDVARTHGRRALLLSLEMSAKEIAQRTLAHTARVPLSKIRAGKDALSDADLDKIAAATSIIGQTPIEYTENPHMTLEDIRGAAWSARQRATRNGETLGIIAVDYVQLIATNGSRTATRQQLLGEVSRGLKRLAKELQVPVMIAAQLNRANQQRGNGGRPILADLREAGDFEQDADVVILLHEETVEEGNGRAVPTGTLEAIIAKSRNGPTGTKTLQKFGHYAKFV